MKLANTVCFLSIVAVACADEKPPPQTPAAVSQDPAPPPAAPPPQKPTDDPARSQINISDEIKRACGITETEAKFAFDSANVRAGDHPVLDKLATCFTTGPLAGRTMRLVGHADPRGEPEYNLALGNQRSDNVKSYLVARGLKDAQGETTSRGEMDATGTDEASWAEDRRVDIVLAD